MSNFLNSVKNLRPKKNAFNLSHGNSLTTDMGLVVPVFARDCVPNSDFRVNTHCLGRMLATVAPVMDNVDLYMHYWKIPYRIIDKYFPKFIAGEITPDNYEAPYFTISSVADELSRLYNTTINRSTFACRGSLFDMLGFYDTPDDLEVSARKFLSYFVLLYYEYRVENIPLVFKYGDIEYDFLDLLENLSRGEQTFDISNLIAGGLFCLGEFNKMSGAVPNTQEYWKMAYFKHAWRKDYFTACFPYLQKGDPVTIPIGGTSAPVSLASGQPLSLRGASGSTLEIWGQEMQNIPSSDLHDATIVTGNFGAEGAGGSGNVQGAYSYLSLPGDNLAGLRAFVGELGTNLTGIADLTEATAITINELRILNALQVYQERKLRYGGRYKEYLKGFFNQSSLDARLDYPEYLGGGKLPFLVSEIAQTSGTTATSPQGNLAGKGTAFGTGFAGFKHTHIYEESLIMGILFIQPKPNYCTGTSRFDTKLNDPFDFFNPSFEHVGEQEVKLYEIYGSGLTAEQSQEIFGYQPRFAEYRVWNNEVHGEFCGTLSYWKLTRQFNAAPSLSKEFVYIQPTTLWGIFATSATPGHLLIDLYFDVKALQPMSKYGTPMLMA